MFTKGKALSPSAYLLMWSSCHLVTSPPPVHYQHLLLKQIKSLDRENKAYMEHTGMYYEPVAN